MLLTTIKCYLWLISRLFDRTLLVKGFVFTAHMLPLSLVTGNTGALSNAPMFGLLLLLLGGQSGMRKVDCQSCYFLRPLFGEDEPMLTFLFKGVASTTTKFFLVKFFTTRPKSSFSACWHGVFLRWCLHPKKSSTCCWTKLWALQTYLPSQKLKWHLKMIMSKRNLFFQGSIFRCELLVFGSVPESFQEFGDCWHMWFV